MRQLFAVALAMVSLLCSCGNASRAYLVTDAPTLAALGGERAAAAMCRAGAGQLGLELRLAVGTEKDLTAKLDQALADAACRLVLLVSAIPVDARQYALDHAGVLFAAYGELGPASPANLLFLVSERADAYREAGRRAGAMLGGGGEGAGVGILAVTPTAGARREIESFREGLEESSPGSTAEYREARSATDKANVVRLLHELRSGGTSIFLLKAYGLTSTCVDDLAKEGGKAIVEDCGGGCGGEVVVSIETDWRATFSAAFAAVDPAAWSWRAAQLQESWRLEGNGNGR